MDATKTRKVLDGIMNTPMNRKQFLTRVGVGALAVSGIGAVSKSFTGNTPVKTSGYGKSAYGQ